MAGLQRLSLLLMALFLAEQAFAFLPSMMPGMVTRPLQSQLWSSKGKSATDFEAVKKAQEAGVAPTAQYLQELPEKVRYFEGAWEFALIERIEPPTKTTGGLFLPTNADDPKYVVRVVTMGSGQVGESGMLAPNLGLKPGDYAFIKQPWGIGPRDEIADGRKFSFVRYKDILGAIAC